MKTAKEVIWEVAERHTGTGYSNQVILEAMEIYASQFKPNLPTDAEIFKMADNNFQDAHQRAAFFNGAFWMRGIITPPVETK